MNKVYTSFLITSILCNVDIYAAETAEANLFRDMGLVLFGAILSLFVTVIILLIEQKIKTKDKKEEVIGNVAKFILGSDDLINDLWADRNIIEKYKDEKPEFSKSYEKKMAQRFDDSTKNNFFEELMYQSFQLQRLGNNNLWKEFEQLMNMHRDLSTKLFQMETFEKCESLDNKYQLKKRGFIERCIELTRISKKLSRKKDNNDK